MFRLIVFNSLLALFLVFKEEIIYKDRVPGTDIGYQLALLMGSMVLPLSIIAYLLNAGFYDGAVYALQKAFGV